jgi:hypothetical protein
MDNMVYILKQLASRYSRKNVFWVNHRLVHSKIHKRLELLKYNYKNYSEKDIIDLRQHQGRKDHFNTKVLDNEWLKTYEKLCYEFSKKEINKYYWSRAELNYVLEAINKASIALRYFTGDKELLLFTVYHNPEVLFLKYFHGTKINCVRHGIQLVPKNFKQKFPLEAGCDVLQLFHSQDEHLVRNQFKVFGLKQPEMCGQFYEDKKLEQTIVIEKIIYLQTIYKKINPALDLIKLKFKLRDVELVLHPRLYSNKIKKLFYLWLCKVIRLNVNPNEYNQRFLYVSNGSTALIKAKNQNCKTAFYSPTGGLKNPYPDYLSIPTYENK